MEQLERNSTVEWKEYLLYTYGSKYWEGTNTHTHPSDALIWKIQVLFTEQHATQNICCMKKQEKQSHKQRLRLCDSDIFIEGPKKNTIQNTWTDWGYVTSLPIHLLLSFVQTCKTFVWLPTLARSENNCEPNNNMCNPGGKSRGTRAVTMNSQSADSHTVSSVRPGQGWTVIRQMAITCSDMTEPYISSAP